MSNQTAYVTQQDLNNSLVHLILADLTSEVDNRQSGHCLQVTDLPADLMESVCQQLLAIRPQSETYVLSRTPTKPWHITSTKLVERRNANQKVIVVFLPPDLRTSAEDSFDISTFERFPVHNLYERLQEQLLNDLPADTHLEEIILESGCTDVAAICRYLLAVQKANATPQAISLALHHLGLVPDLALLDDPAILRPRLKRNQQCVETLSASDKVLLAKIQTIGLKDERTPQALYRFFDQIGTFDPTRWLPAILQGQFVNELTFDQWEFREEITGNVEEIVFTNLGTRHKNDDGYLVIDTQHDKAIKIVWETTPPPLRCKVAHFTLEIMKDGAPVTEARTIKVGTSSRKERSTTLRDLHKLDLEDGLYYFRVSAWTAEGVLLRSAESESVLFKGGTETEEDDTEGEGKRLVVPRVNSRYEAMLHAQVELRKRDKTLADLKRVEVAWASPERRTGQRYTDYFTIKYSSAIQYALSVNSILRRIEEETLIDADSLGRWNLDLSQSITAEIELTLQPFEGIDYDLLGTFLMKRRNLFQKILNQPANPDIRFLVETSDLSEWENEIIDYVQAYIDVIDALAARLASTNDLVERQAILHSNRQVTSIDSVRLRLLGGEYAYLISPTHPLKLIWGLQYARVSQHWLSDLEALPGNQVSWNTFEGFLPRLSSLNLPHALVDVQGELIVNVDNFGPFWSIFVPLGRPDTRAVVGRIKTLLGSPEADERFTTITGVDLQRKIQRYLAQHPYITTLRLNAIQPGSGAILVGMLLELERQRHDLRYQVHLFSADFRREELGIALDELMAPSEKHSGRASEELDAFLTASHNALFPKLVYSKHDIT